MEAGEVVSEIFFQEVAGAVEPIAQLGFTMIDALYDEKHFGDGYVLWASPDGGIRMRVTQERMHWFVEIGSSADPDDWFDARDILAEIGVTSVGDDATDYPALKEICELLAFSFGRWVVLFSMSGYPTARARLRAIQMARAKELFGR